MSEEEGETNEPQNAEDIDEDPNNEEGTETIDQEEADQYPEDFQKSMPEA